MGQDDPLDFLNEPDAHRPNRARPIPPQLRSTRSPSGLNAKTIWGIVLIILGIPATVASAVRMDGNNIGSPAMVLLVGGGVLIYFGLRKPDVPKEGKDRERATTLAIQHQAQQQKRREWHLRMSSQMRGEEISPLATCVYQQLLSTDAKLRIGFQTSTFTAATLTDRLAATLVNLDQLAAERECPTFCEVATTVHSCYREICRLTQTLPRHKQYLIGGGFGIRGAAEGIAIAEGINWVLNQPARQQAGVAVNAISDNLRNAHALLQLLRERCSPTEQS